MNINDYIKDLSIKDKKNLSEKFTKLISETGELASVLLPYISAPGSNDKFSDRESILDEIVDVQLVLTSILHDIGFTDEEFEEMMIKKSKKWGLKQSIEEQAQFPLPFETHITVEISGDNFDPDYMDGSLEYFKQCCKTIGVKPIVLDLEINGESPMKDIMTSSKHFGDNRSAYDDSERISNELREMGYKVIRKKIETVPWHVQAPTFLTESKEIPNGCYFESHIGVSIYPSQKDELNDFVKNIEDTYAINFSGVGDPLTSLNGTAKLSQNFFKKSKDGSKFINMLTYRSNKSGRYKFESEVNNIKELLSIYGFNYEKVEVEYAIYDTNTNHDSKWING